MLVVDTNVVVRYLTGDDPAQARIAESLVTDNELYLLGTVMLETEWVLRSLYGFSRERVLAAMRAFAGLEHVRVDDPERMAAALDWFEQGMDFADALHLASCESDDVLVTFDRKLKVVAGKAGAKNVKLLRK